MIDCVQEMRTWSTIGGGAGNGVGGEGRDFPRTICILPHAGR